MNRWVSSSINHARWSCGARHSGPLNVPSGERFPNRPAPSPVNRPFKMSIFCRSRGHEAQISSETQIYLETPHVVSYFINGLAEKWQVKNNCELYPLFPVQKMGRELHPET